MNAHWTVGNDYTERTETEARAIVETTGEGYIVHWVYEFDGRNYRPRSTSTKVYRNGLWNNTNIHS